jgi:hypothetical protein
MAKNPSALQLLSTHLQQIQQNMPKAPAEPPKVNFSFAEDAMGDPEVRQYFEQTTGVTPTAAPTPKPQAPKAGPPDKGPAGAARAMRNSNDNSGPVGNKPQPEPGLAKAA